MHTHVWMFTWSYSLVWITKAFNQEWLLNLWERGKPQNKPSKKRAVTRLENANLNDTRRRRQKCIKVHLMQYIVMVMVMHTHVWLYTWRLAHILYPVCTFQTHTQTHSHTHAHTQTHTHTHQDVTINSKRVACFVTQHTCLDTAYILGHYKCTVRMWVWAHVLTVHKVYKKMTFVILPMSSRFTRFT
jgi:hypothetical protein